MNLPKPEYSKTQVDKAGDILITAEPNAQDYTFALNVLNNWRACHNYPINTFQATLRTRLRSFGNDTIVAQRLKRIPTIVDKLKRYTTMKLSQMQDIGGLRAIVADMNQVRRLEKLYREGRFKHRLVKEKDYIEEPKKISGYRSLHLIYRYNNDQAPSYKGLLVELQIRTKIQHIWATAVETVGLFVDHALKSSKGPDEWLDFFKLTSAAFACIEDTPVCDSFKNMSKKAVYKEVHDIAGQLNIKGRLRSYAITADAISQDKKRGKYHLIELDPESKTVTIRSYGKNNLEQANIAYTEVEEKNNKKNELQTVLVSTDSIEMLRRAYPNFFLDTNDFIKELNKIGKLAK